MHKQTKDVISTIWTFAHDRQGILDGLRQHIEFQQTELQDRATIKEINLTQAIINVCLASGMPPSRTECECIPFAGMTKSQLISALASLPDYARVTIWANEQINDIINVSIYDGGTSPAECEQGAGVFAALDFEERK